MPTSRADIHAPQKSCPGCPFKGPKVGSKGDPTSPIVFVAESPGRMEVNAKEPLVGPSGRIFHEFIPDDGSVYILNALECSPLAALKNEKSLNQAVSCCQEHLLEKIAAHPRRIIVAMGNAAVRSLTNNYSLKITQIRGRLIPSPLSELGIMPVVHIAALMRGGGSFRQWKQDMYYAYEMGLGADPRPYTPAEVQIIPDDADEEYMDFLFEQMLWRNDGLTGDIETTGFDHLQDDILSLGITPQNDPLISYCFYPVHWPLIQKYIESPEIVWSWHNGKFDIKFFWTQGIRARVDDDTMLLSYALDEEGGVHDLESVSSDVLGAPDYKYMVKPWLPNAKTSYAAIPPNILAAYQAIDTSNTARCLPILRERVRRQPMLEKLYTETLIPASAMLAQVERNGICVDVDRLDENEVYFTNMKVEIGQEINDMIGYEINPGSPQQVSRLLFKGYKFPNRAKGSTAFDVLEKLQKQTEHPIFALLMKHRTAVKMYGTYVKGLRKWLQPGTNRVHATYLIHGTRTGRLSAREPNMQNPPRLPQIRGSFIASPGHELLEMDYSQAELRNLACLSGDEELIRIYNSGGDIHDEMALFLFPGWDKSTEEGYEQRVKCKNVNFGIVYGISKFGLQGQIGGPLAEADRMIQGWYERFPGAASFIMKCRNAPSKNQVITTCFGRKKRTGLVSRQNLSFLMNEASNFPPQSISSDLTLHVAIRNWRWLLERKVRIVNLVHDSLIMEVPITPLHSLRYEVINHMTQEFEQVPRDYGIDQIPFVTDAEVGHRWGSLIDIKKLPPGA
jgi:DNA polymerase-1